MNATVIVIVGLPLMCVGILAIAVLSLLPKSLNESIKKREVWPVFARLISGTLTNGVSGQVDTISAKIDGDSLYLDTYVYGANHTLVNATRMRVFYRSFCPFEIIVRTEKMGHLAQEAQRLNTVNSAMVGLSSDYTVYCSDSTKLETFFDSSLIDRIEAARMIDLQIRKRRNWKNQGISHSIYEVQAQKPGIVTDLSELTDMYKLVQACLFKLREQHIAGRLADDIQPVLDYFSNESMNEV